MTSTNKKDKAGSSSSSVELLPCPFCGGDPKVREQRLRPNMSGKTPGLVSVTISHHCPPVKGNPSGINVQQRGRDHEAAIAAWNTRPQTQDISPWRDISSAPKGGKPFIAIFSDDYLSHLARTNAAKMAVVRCCVLDCGYESWSLAGPFGQGFDRDCFTHWMPLPEGPDQSTDPIQNEWRDISTLFVGEKYDVKVEGGEILEDCRFEGYWWFPDHDGVYVALDLNVTHYRPSKAKGEGS